LRELLRSQDVPAFLDVTARKFLSEARDEYARQDLDDKVAIDQGNEVMLLTWLGDAANEALACLFLRRGFTAMAAGPGVEVHKKAGGVDEVLDALGDFAVEDVPDLDILLADAKNLAREKWDWALPDGLLRKAYASQYLDLAEAADWVKAAGQAHAGS
jgi:ATP-dependent Lhr-like helicase